MNTDNIKATYLQCGKAGHLAIVKVHDIETGKYLYMEASKEHFLNKRDAIAYAQKMKQDLLEVNGLHQSHLQAV